MEKTKISVIIPIYNVEKYIEGCLKSIINQTLKEIEIICINDGTPDNSMKIVDKIAKKDKRIKVFNKENGGLSSARNYGIDKATSKYIYFIDSDDQLKENALEILYNKMEEEDLDTLFFDAENVYEDEGNKENSFINDNYYIRKHKYSDEYTGQTLFRALKKNNEYRASACLQINKLSLIKEHDIKFIEGIIHEDEVFTAKICLFSKKAAHIKEVLYLRLVQENSIMSSSKSLKRCYGYFKGLIELIDVVSENVDKECLNAFKSHLRELQNSSVKYLRDSLDPEKPDYNSDEMMEFKDSLSNKERILYELLIERVALYLSRVDIEKKKLKEQNSIKLLLKRRIRKYINKFKKKIEKIAVKYFGKKYISIIMPVYNCEDYLRDALDSLLEQTLKEIEIICIDDSSTDKSFEILKEYAAKDKRVIAIQQEHSNAGNARNIGISKARGKYLLFLDSDDFFDKDLCKTTYHYANYYDVDLLLFSAYKYDNETKEIENYQTLLNTDYINVKELYTSKDLKDHLYHITSSCPWTKLFKKKYIKDNHLRFQPLTNSNDVYFTRCSMALANRIMAIPDKLVYYRVNQKNNTQSTKHKKPLNFIKAYLEVKKTLEERGVFEDFYKTYLNVLITEIVYNYNSTKTEEAKKEIKSYLEKEGFKKLGIDKIDEDLIYAKVRYEDFKEIFK